MAKVLKLKKKKKLVLKGKPKVGKPSFKPLIKCDNPDVRQIYAGFEIEKRWLLISKEKDHTKNQNGLILYDEALSNGTLVKQGYIKDIQVAKDVLDDLGIEVINGFKPNTVRLRKYGDDQFIFTLKDRKKTKKREVEFDLTEKKFVELWPLTKGSRIYKKRMIRDIKGNKIEFDAFLDRFLLICEIEVNDEEKLKSLPELGLDITGNSALTNKAMSK